MPATFAAITTKLGLLRVAAVTIGLVVGTLCVCSSDADLVMEFAMNAATGADESAFAIAHGIGAVEIADYPLPDPCDSQLHQPEGTDPTEPDSTPCPGVSAATAHLAVDADCLAEAHDTLQGSKFPRAKTITCSREATTYGTSCPGKNGKFQSGAPEIETEKAPEEPELALVD